MHGRLFAQFRSCFSRSYATRLVAGLARNLGSGFRGAGLLKSAAATIVQPIGFGILLSVAGVVQAQTTQSVVRTLPTRLNPPAHSASSPTTSRVIEHYVPEAHPAASQIPDSILSWDAPEKDHTAKLGEAEALFTFNVTNVSKENVTIQSVSTSCGCTVAQLPSNPWILAPGSNGQLHATMNLAGKIGNITKTLTIHSDKGERMLMVRASIPTGVPRGNPEPVALVTQREANQKQAQADRQSVFRGDCASCHVEPAKGKTGQELYAAACGICHDSPQRANSVPDLRHLKHETNTAYWREWILHGKAGTMMPAFAQTEGGPLNDSEANTLADYLSTAIPT